MINQIPQILPCSSYVLPTQSRMELNRMAGGVFIYGTPMKPIPNFPGYYATEDGKIYSARPRGRSGRFGSPRELRRMRPAGQHQVQLFRDGRRCPRIISRLILETFVGPCPPGMECCHGSLGRENHSLSNLEWGTKSKNNGPDKLRDGTDFRGVKHPLVKLTELQVRIIRHLKGKILQREAAEIFRVSRGQIGRIQFGKRWK